ncbi:putative NAD(P)/FAD-binding protein YdhS [Pedobacter psychrotolerans]|uniref:FAD/NAD(P) binding domain-containing protein n=1 Tax=Pedobacter psychrotolerans TaxID=1843235 RepID=A0A4R2HI82_9SPHI|nr:FAD/NAD(P)-binding protein [Pedobacter psychrotolerans]TCO28971.1 putative NAD(P)/FAD-binding protein YdhS [Pedobacter psychrotolerans]GGE53172.1 FAD/NAD(P) binding domain-containing protein [Pedobacter psychrotolerans]
MTNKANPLKIAILGGGPSGLFMYKRLVESGIKNLVIEIFERKDTLGSGMPYSTEGANEEHITNVSDNEIPVIFNSIEDWVKMAPKPLLKKFNINSDTFNEYKVLPRLFFGEYLSAQFELLKEVADEQGVVTKVSLNTQVTDIIDDPAKNNVGVEINGGDIRYFDHIIVCVGHNWPKKHEGKVPGYYDSPYPPKKLAKHLNHPIAIMGSSLTAIDAIRTLARNNGAFEAEEDGTYKFILNENSSLFKIVMHSRNGLLPAIRFHLEDSHLGKDETLSKAEIQQNIKENGGFIPLDFVFEKNFKDQFKKRDAAFYEKIKDMDLETFVEAMMSYRENVPPFDLFRKEYEEAEKSIKREESIYWKEALAVLSFAMNYPAKYLCAEDMQRLQKELMPLISIVIAFVPQSSCRDLMALHDAGVLEIVSVGEDSSVEPHKEGGATYIYTNDQGDEVSIHYKTFISCIGQPHLSYDDFPFKGLVEGGSVSPAMLNFKSPDIGKEEVEKGNKLVEKNKDGLYALKVPGITINDTFQVVGEDGQPNDRIYIMAVPYIGGYNPDYSGIDFCEAASMEVLKTIQSKKNPEV